MEEILELFPNREAFEKYWEENYLPVEYKDVKSAYEEYVKSVDKHIFLADYEETGCIGERDFLENLSEDAQFFFQDALKINILPFISRRVYICQIVRKDIHPVLFIHHSGPGSYLLNEFLILFGTFHRWK